VDSKDYYDKEYASDTIREFRISFLYRKLKRFELNRYDLAYRLAPGGDRVLDIGCGDGELLFLLRSKYTEVWGVDIAESRINRLKKKLGNDIGIHVRIEDAHGQVGFEDGFFDTITTVAVLEHIFDPYHLAKECHRLLRGGGSLIVQVPNIAWLPYRIRSLMEKVPEPPHCEDAEWDYAHLHSFTRQSLKKLLEREGFEVVKVTCGGILAGPRRIYGSLLGADIAMVGVKKT